MLLVLIQMVEIIGAAIAVHQGSSIFGLMVWMLTLGSIQLTLVYGEYHEKTDDKIVEDEKK